MSFITSTSHIRYLSTNSDILWHLSGLCKTVNQTIICHRSFPQYINLFSALQSDLHTITTVENWATLLSITDITSKQHTWDNLTHASSIILPLSLILTTLTFLTLLTLLLNPSIPSWNFRWVTAFGLLSALCAIIPATTYTLLINALMNAYGGYLAVGLHYGMVTPEVGFGFLWGILGLNIMTWFLRPFGWANEPWENLSWWGKGRRLRAIQRMHEARAWMEYERAHPSEREDRELPWNAPSFCNKIGCHDTTAHFHD